MVRILAHAMLVLGALRVVVVVAAGRQAVHRLRHAAGAGVLASRARRRLGSGVARLDALGLVSSSLDRLSRHLVLLYSRADLELRADRHGSRRGAADVFAAGRGPLRRRGPFGGG